MGKILQTPSVIDISGNAETATKLKNSFTIDGTPFDGTESIVTKYAYNCSSYSDNSKYIVLAKIPKDLDKHNRRVGMIVTGGTSFGYSELPLFYVTAGVYASYRMHVTLLGNTVNEQDVINIIKFGYYVDDTYMVIVIKTNSYYNLNASIVGYSSSDIIINTMEKLDTVPDDFVEVPVVKYIPESELKNSWLTYSATFKQNVTGDLVISVNKLLNLMIFHGHIDYTTANTENAHTDLFTLPDALCPATQMDYRGRFLIFDRNDLTTPKMATVVIQSSGLVYQTGNVVPPNTPCRMYFADMVFHNFQFKNT